MHNSSQFRLFYLILILGINCSLSFKVVAQQIVYEDLYDESSFESQGINISLPVGATAGSADISNGTSSYVIPIQIPAGTNGVSPELSIAYSSQGGNGHMGIGWGITGISSISRGLRTIFHDGKSDGVKLDSEDALLLDGTRLVEKTTGVYVKEMYDYSSIMKEGVYGSAGLWYRLETKHGVVYEYGKDFNSALKSEDGTEIIVWKVSKIIYKDGNYIEYHYDNSDRDHRISQIRYTGNINTGLLPYNVIDFQYLDRGEYKNTTYEAESKINLNYLVDKLVISTESNEVMKEYHFTYADDDINVFLKEVQEIGSEGSSLNPTIFKYGDLPLEYTYDDMGYHPEATTDIYTGDFNGDGYTDKLEASIIEENGKYYHDEYKVFTKLPNPNNDDFSLEFTKILPELGTISQRGTQYNFYSGDYTGEGRDDIVYMYSDKIIPTIPALRKINSVDLHEMNINASGITETNISIGTSNNLYFFYDHKPFITGDFNGDGIIDILLIVANELGNFELNDYRAYIYYGNISTEFEEASLTGSFTLGMNSWNVKNINVIDINGDGRNELMITNDLTSEIFEFDDLTISSINGSGTGFPTQYHLMFFGDFNGDRKTDMLTRTDLNDNDSPWFVSRSDGNGFVEDEEEFLWISNPPEVNEDYMGDLIIIGDYNGDGKSDIARGLNLFENYSIQFYYSKGNDFIYDAFVNIQNSAELNLYGAHDFNGDGRTELMNQVGDNIKILKIRPQGEELVLQKVKNGHGHVIEFGYTNMTRIGSSYTRDAMTAHPINTVRLPMLLPDQITKDGYHRTDYEYKNAKLHKEGKGFLGFEEINTKVFNDNDMNQTRKYEIDPDHVAMVPVLIKSYLNLTILNTRTLTNTFTSYSDALEDIDYYTYHITASIDDNVFEGRTTTTNTVFDDYGNATYSNMDINGIESRITNTIFGTYNTLIPASPTSTSTTITRTGSPGFTTATGYSYTSIGQVESMTSFPGKSKAVTETYVYNALGNRTHTTMSASGFDDRSSVSIYDSKGRYIEQSTNTLGQVSTATYDPKWSKPLSTTGIDGLTTTHTYDEYGRLATSTSPTGFTLTDIYEWEDGAAVYSSSSIHPGAPDATSYYDALDRVIQQTSEGYGLTKSQNTTYDLRGNISVSTSPTGFTSTTIYDEYNRPSTITNDFGTTSITHAYSGGNLITNVTNSAGQVSSITKDATDKVISSTDYGGTLNFTYHSHGDLATTSNATHTLVSTNYDEYGRQISLVDIDAGTTLYEYDALGQLISETSAKGETTTLNYDDLGQLLERTGVEGITTNTYYPTGSGASTNLLHTVTSFGGDIEEYIYDSYGRVGTYKHTLDGSTYEFGSTYDIYGNLETYTYPSGYSLNYIYNNNGYNTEINDGSKVLFELTSMNALDQLTEYKDLMQGNTASVNTLTFHHGIPTHIKMGGASVSTTGTEQDYVWDYTTGNLQSREYKYDGVGFGIQEEFGYDNMNRLASFNKIGYDAKIINYQDNGNINDKHEVGTLYTYAEDKIHAVNGIQGADYSSLSMYSQDITYTSFMQPYVLKEKGNKLTYSYGADYQRLKSVLDKEDGTTETRVYLGGYETFDDGNGLNHLHYINVGRGIHAIVHRVGGEDTYFRTFTDYQGSVMALDQVNTDDDHYFNYDPWGRRRNYISGDYVEYYSGPRWFTRGYTGHEHLEGFSLINMNGRLFDPVIGRMLSPDNFVQSPYNTQSYNRYSYVLNNPLKYTDPSGELFVGLGIAALKGIAIAVGTNGIINTLNHKSFFSGSGKAAIFGAIGGVLSAGIGNIAAGGTFVLESGKIVGVGKVGTAFFQAFAHGWTGTIISAAQGSNPLSGFASGSISSGVSSGSGALLGGGTVSTILSGGLSGGIGSKLTGGRFWDGVNRGLITSGLNHVAHVIVSRIEANIYVKAARAFLEDLGFDPTLVEQNVVTQSDGFFGKYYAKLNNYEFFTGDWLSQYDSRSGEFSALVSPSLNGYSLKYYGESRAHSLGLIRTGLMHYYEAGMEYIDGSIRNATAVPHMFWIGAGALDEPYPGFDNTVYNMHRKNSTGYLNNR